MPADHRQGLSTVCGEAQLDSGILKERRHQLTIGRMILREQNVDGPIQFDRGFPGHLFDRVGHIELQLHRKAGTPTRFALDRNGAPHQFHQATGYRQAEACSAITPADGAIRLREPIKELGKLDFGHADPAVDDADHEQGAAAGARLNRHIDVDRPVVRELYGV